MLRARLLPSILGLSTFLPLIAALSVSVPAGARGQDDELPDGAGKKILQASCTSCHDLKEVTKFRGYYTRDDWRGVVITMVDYGAELKDAEVDVLVDYLTTHLGRR